MTTVFFTIYIIIPLMGLLSYLNLIRKMNREHVVQPPTLGLFFLFVNYGGLLLVILTSLFWKWSAMASLGSFYLITVAPVVVGIIAYRNYKLRLQSTYHKWAFRSAVSYYFIAPFLIALI